MLDKKEIIPVVQFKDSEKTLRKLSVDVPIEEIRTEKFQMFLQTLYNSMMDVKMPKGWIQAGISAVQIGKHINVFIAYDSNSEHYEIFINPEVELLGSSTDLKMESCLSIPEIQGKVRRHKRVKVTYYNSAGEKVKKKFSGWNARVIQHEHDHLLGILFIDKIEG